MRGVTFDRQAEAAARHALLFSKILEQVVYVAPGLPGHQSVVDLIDATEIRIKSQFRDGEGVHIITQKIEVSYSILKVTDA